MSNLVKHAEEEMRRAGLYDKYSDYGDLIPRAVMALVETHAAQRHSGGSHGLALDIFNRVVNFKTLTPITNDPTEWVDVAHYAGPKGEPLWQNRRDCRLFSHDGGKTHWNVDDKLPPFARLRARLGLQWRRVYVTQEARP